MSLGESGEGLSSMELCFELIDVVFAELEKIVGAADNRGVSCRRVVIIVDKATYGGQIISSPGSRDEVVGEGFWRKNWGVLSSKRPSFVVREFAQGFSFGMGTEWSRPRKPLESEFGEMGPAWVLIPLG